MAQFPKSLKDYINVAALRAYTKTVEAEYFMLKELHEHLALSMGDDDKAAGKPRKRGPRGKVKNTVLSFLHKNQKGKAIEIAKLSGLKKAGHVSQAKKRGSPFVLVKK